MTPTLLDFMRAVVRGDLEAVSRLVAETPSFATRQSAVGATRQQSDEFFFPEIAHYLYEGDTALHMAAAAQQVAVVEHLLALGADANAINRRGAAPLHYACDSRPDPDEPDAGAVQESVIRLLQEHGAELDRADRGGATPLHRAVRRRSVPAVYALLTRGANPNARLGTRGSTPLHLATQSTGASGTAGLLDEQLSIIGLLLEHGADPTLVDAAGRTPTQWAKNPRIIRALGA